MILAGSGPAWADEAQPTITGAASAATAAQPADQQTANDQGASPAATNSSSDRIVITGFRASLQSAVNKKKSPIRSLSRLAPKTSASCRTHRSAKQLPACPASHRSGFRDARTSSPSAASVPIIRPRSSTVANRPRPATTALFSSTNIRGSHQSGQYLQDADRVRDRAGHCRYHRPAHHPAAGVWEAVISVGGRAVYPDIGKLNPDAKKFGYRVNGVYVDQFAEGRAGISLAASWDDEPYEIQEFNAWGYADGPGGNKVVGGLKSYSRSTELKRLGLTGTAEFKPVDRWTSTVDGFYSDFKDDQIARGIEVPLQWGGGGSTPHEVLQPGFHRFLMDS